MITRRLKREPRYERDKNVEQVYGEGDTLSPVTRDEKTWGWFAIFNIWANDIQSLFGYSLVASLFIP